MADTAREQGKRPLYFTIGEAAARIGVGSSTLRDWERDGLIRPAERTPMGHRRYTEPDIMRLVVFAIERAKENMARVVGGVVAPPPNGSGPKGGRPRKGHGGEGKGFRASSPERASSTAENPDGSGSDAAGEPVVTAERLVTGTRRLEGEAAA